MAFRAPSLKRQIPNRMLKLQLFSMSNYTLQMLELFRNNHVLLHHYDREDTDY